MTEMSIPAGVSVLCRLVRRHRDVFAWAGFNMLGTVSLALIILYVFRVLPHSVWIACFFPSVVLLTCRLSRVMLTTRQAVWLWIALGIAMLVVVAQSARYGEITVEIDSLGRIATHLDNAVEDGDLSVVVQSSLLMLPVSHRDEERGLLRVSMPAQYPAEDAMWLSRPPAVTIGFFHLGSAAGEPSFLVGLHEAHETSELMLEFRRSSDTPARNEFTEVWRVSDGAGWFESRQDDYVDLYAHEPAVFYVTEGPVLVIPTGDYLRPTISHGSAVSYVHVENLETEGPMILVYTEDLTRSLLLPGTLPNVRIWRELALWRTPTDHSYYRCVNYGPAYESPFIVVGMACRVEKDGHPVYSTDEPFVAVLHFRSFWPCFITHGVPYVSLVHVQGNPACECAGVSFRRISGDQGAPIPLVLEECSGTVWFEGGRGYSTFSEYDVLAVSLVNPTFEPRAERPGEFVLRGQSRDVRINGGIAFWSVWEYLPTFIEWIIYSVLTLLWLPILRRIQKHFWSE